MFEFITNTEERGQVGIGTLIVFIAMVLVAAIAAGVLINTAGFLQSQAEATGEESTDLVSERIEVVSSVGIVDDADAGTLDEIRVTVSGAPGADDIDLTETTIQAVGPDGQENLVFVDEPVEENEVTQLSVPQIDDTETSFDITIDYSSIDGLEAGDNQDLEVTVDQEGGDIVSDSITEGDNLDQTTVEADSGGDIDLGLDGPDFSTDDEVTVTLEASDDSIDPIEVTQIVGAGDGSVEATTTEETTQSQNVENLGANEFAVGEDGQFEESPVLDSEDQFTILLNPASGAFDDGDAFGESDTATLDIVSPAGAATQVELRSPDLYNSNGEAVRL